MEFSDTSVQLVKTLASLASVLNLKDTSLHSFKVALADVIVKECETELELERQRDMLETIQKRRRWTANAAAIANRALEQFEAKFEESKENEEEWRRNTSILVEKGKEYEERIEHLKKLDALCPDADLLEYEQIHQLETQLEDLRTQIADRQSMLAGYRDLPPDIALARIKVGEKKQELAALIEKRQELLERML